MKIFYRIILSPFVLVLYLIFAVFLWTSYLKHGMGVVKFEHKNGKNL